jgi:hypothetical protein
MTPKDGNMEDEINGLADLERLDRWLSARTIGGAGK